MAHDMCSRFDAHMVRTLHTRGLIVNHSCMVCLKPPGVSGLRSVPFDYLEPGHVPQYERIEQSDLYELPVTIFVDSNQWDQVRRIVVYESEISLSA